MTTTYLTGRQADRPPLPADNTVYMATDTGTRFVSSGGMWAPLDVTNALAVPPVPTEDDAGFGLIANADTLALEYADVVAVDSARLLPVMTGPDVGKVATAGNEGAAVYVTAAALRLTQGFRCGTKAIAGATATVTFSEAMPSTFY